MFYSRHETKASAMACGLFLSLASAFSQGLAFSVSTNFAGTNVSPIVVAMSTATGKWIWFAPIPATTR
jgi:hypothetical protein